MPLAPALALLAAVSAPATSAPTRAIEHTYLKALPGQRPALIRYIRDNWFAMDRIGRSQGLFTSYRLLERDGAEDPAAEWDVVVAVGYPDPRGYDAPGVAARFAAIRAAHREIRVNGRGLPELGRIVRSERLHPVTGEDSDV
ncbi:hypothetical protein AB5I39_03110 [Sphingomonas sp. MMS24-J45]|uniref:hypothetical protein n=1 Tax=Sphingomonas sp. MMS24-J45 TaxID=3238806 RepID=UPI00384B23DD